VSTVHSSVKRNVTVILQHFCHNILRSSCCGGHCSLLTYFITKDLVAFWLFCFIFCCLIKLSMLQHDQAYTAVTTSNCSNKRCACSNKRRIYKRKKIGFFFSRNYSNKRFALQTDAPLSGFHCTKFRCFQCLWESWVRSQHSRYNQIGLSRKKAHLV